MGHYYPQRLYVEKDVAHSSFAGQVLKTLPGVPAERIGHAQEILPSLRRSQDPFGKGKLTLVLAKNRGAFLEPCPGTPHYLCCGYHVLNVGTNCSMNCSYCILQAYLTNPCLILYANLEDMFEELEQKLTGASMKVYRIGTGEFSDSLSLDHLTRLASRVVPYFSRKRSAWLEFKTKSNQVAHLLDIDHGGRIVVSWSLNSERMIAAEEHGSSTLVERIAAARAVQEAGYWLGFHFDPLIHYPGWEDDYRRVLDQLFQRIDPRRVVWVSLGSFRYMPRLKQVVEGRFRQSSLFSGEFVRGRDNKMRYFQPLRVELYAKMREWLEGVDARLFVYLCMEGEKVWREVFGDAPRTSAELAERIDQHLLASVGA
jgi:spore photoproduct lyase